MCTVPVRNSDFMPRAGYSSITVSNQLYNRIKGLAANKGVSLAKFLEELIVAPDFDTQFVGVPAVE